MLKHRIKPPSIITNTTQETIIPTEAAEDNFVSSLLPVEVNKNESK